MKSKRIVSLLSLTAAVSGIFIGYVARQWPSTVEEMSIPPGKIQMMPGGLGKGICLQGDPNGLSLWYQVTPKQLTPAATRR